MELHRSGVAVCLCMSAVAATAQQAAPSSEAQPKSLAATLQVYVFPSDGQSASQQSKDEGACYQWAVRETGSDPFDVQKHEAAVAQQEKEKTKEIESAGAGAGAKGGLGGAAAGALIGEVSHGDVGESAAIGAAVGVVAGRRKARLEKEEAAEQVQGQSQQAVQADEAKIAGFKKAFSTCLEGKKYTVKY